MKSFNFLFVLFLTFFPIFLLAQSSCPEPYSGWSKKITTSTYYWYWDENVNGALFKDGNNQYINDIDEKRQIVESAIISAVNAWKNSVNSRGIIISSFERATSRPPSGSNFFEVIFTNLSGDLGNTPNSHLMYITSDEPWTNSVTQALAGNAFDINTVITHEMGHIFLGGGHQLNDNTSIMDPDVGSDYPVRRGLNSCDVKILLSYYNPKWYVPIDNNFTDNTGNSTHGQMRVKIGNGNETIYTVPVTLPAIIGGTNLTLTAISPQTDNEGYQRVWYSGTYAIPSNWTRDGLFQSSSQAYTHTPTYHDDGVINQANLTQAKVTTSGYIYEDQTWFTNVTLTGDIDVRLGATLTIVSDRVDLNGKSITTSSNGTINLINSPTIYGLRASLKNISGTVQGLFSTIQSAANNADNYDIINIPSGTFNEYVSVDNKLGVKINGAGINNTTINNDITFENSDASGVSNLTNNYTEFYNCDDITTANHSSELYINDCDDADVSPTVNSSEEAFDIANGSSNCVIDYAHFTNNYTGVYVYGSSNASIYYTTFCSNNWDIIAANYSTVDASFAYNTFSANPVPHSGEVYLPTSISTCGMSKASPIASLNKSAGTNDDPAYTSFAQVMNSYRALSKEVRNDTKESGEFQKEKYIDRYTSLIDSMKSFIQEYPNSNFSKSALVVIVSCYKKLKDFDTMKLFLEKLEGDKKYDLSGGLAKRFMVDYYLKNADYNQALSTADEIIKEQKSDEDLVCNAIFRQGLIYQYSLSDKDKASKCFTSIINKYPNNKLVKQAKNHLGYMDMEVKAILADSSANTIGGFSTESYPNPFNPTTMINYTLPTDEKVVIKVYDILGKEVAELVNEQKAAGTYRVQFDGSNLSSGIYLYSITAGKYHQTKKIMLVK